MTKAAGKQKARTRATPHRSRLKWHGRRLADNGRRRWLTSSAARNINTASESARDSTRDDATGPSISTEWGTEGFCRMPAAAAVSLDRSLKL